MTTGINNCLSFRRWAILAVIDAVYYFKHGISMPTIKQRLKLLERAIKKMPPLILQCYEQPDDAQLLQIEAAERSGRRVIVFCNRYATVWISGEKVPWRGLQCD